jgi:rfaE bifunctional protein nucleotidyltransferase chain/domain
MICKLTSITKAKETIQNWQSNNKTVVFTNGCFDILHAGHIQYLTQAKELGDYLVIAINSDQSVKKLKGINRPINKQEDRGYVLSALECVDLVVIFEEDTPTETLSELKPDIHVKGGDYIAEEMPEYKTVKSYDGEVKILPFRAGHSTTNIINNF